MAERITAAPIATAYTYEFVRRSLPDGAADILEVGCGAGELAARLSQDGLHVTALDSDPECVARARAAGVDARVAAWPTELQDRFDAVLFTRSLHHIGRLEAAVRAAANALRAGGRIIVEDFRAEGGTERSRCWYGGLVRLLETGGVFPPGTNAQALLAAAEPGDHGHELHSSQAIALALRDVGSLEQHPAAYYFRYLEPAVPSAAAEALLEHELALIDAGAIDALGRRYVVHPEL